MHRECPASRSHPPSHGSVRSGQRIADRRCAVACGGKGTWRVLGPCLHTRLFRDAAPYGVLSTEPCSPEKLNPVPHTAGLITSRVASHAHVPLAPCDPASGSRTGGALRRRAGEGGAGGHWADARARLLLGDRSFDHDNDTECEDGIHRMDAHIVANEETVKAADDPHMLDFRP